MFGYNMDITGDSRWTPPRLELLRSAQDSLGALYDTMDNEDISSSPSGPV